MNFLKPPKIAIYSAIYGYHDELKAQIEQTYPVDYILFTDNEKLNTQDTNWTIRYDKRSDTIPEEVKSKYKKNDWNKHRLEAKFYKCNSHLVLPEYDITLWIDGSAIIKSPNLIKFLLRKCIFKDAVFITHPERNNIYEEAEFSKRFEKYNGFDLTAQVESYRRDGMSDNSGLLSGGMLFRKNNKRMNAANELWWNENLKWSYQDQLSLQYVLWKNKVKYKELMLSLWENDLIMFRSHKTMK